MCRRNASWNVVKDFFLLRSYKWVHQVLSVSFISLQVKPESIVNWSYQIRISPSRSFPLEFFFQIKGKIFTGDRTYMHDQVCFWRYSVILCNWRFECNGCDGNRLWHSFFSLLSVYVENIFQHCFFTFGPQNQTIKCEKKRFFVNVFDAKKTKIHRVYIMLTHQSK